MSAFTVDLKSKNHFNDGGDGDSDHHDNHVYIEDEVSISLVSEWCNILVLEYSFADYETKLINGVISFNKNENPKKEFIEIV